MTPLHLELPFRGKRTYLQGADLYDAVMNTLLPARPDLRQARVSVSYHALLTRRPWLVVGEENAPPERTSPAYRGAFALRSAQKTTHVLLMESDQDVAARVPCDEDNQVAAAEIHPTRREAVLTNPATGSAAVLVVALNKKLHHAALPGLAARWIFTRFELPAPLPAGTPRHLEVRLRGIMGGAMTRSDVFLDHQPAGSVFFCADSPSHP